MKRFTFDPRCRLRGRYYTEAGRGKAAPAVRSCKDACLRCQNQSPVRRQMCCQLQTACSSLSHNRNGHNTWCLWGACYHCLGKAGGPTAATLCLACVWRCMCVWTYNLYLKASPSHLGYSHAGFACNCKLIIIHRPHSISRFELVASAAAEFSFSLSHPAYQDCIEINAKLNLFKVNVESS